MLILFKLAAIGSVAWSCGFRWEPTDQALAMPLPVGAIVLQVPLDSIPQRPGCEAARAVLMGCSAPALRMAWVPTPETWHGTPECLEATVEHERTHLIGGEHE